MGNSLVMAQTCDSCPKGLTNECKIEWEKTKDGICLSDSEWYFFGLEQETDIIVSVTPDADTDVDLYVNWDTSCPATSSYGCVSNKGKAGEIEECQNKLFTATPYYLMVKRVSGSGCYKVFIGKSIADKTTSSIKASETSNIIENNEKLLQHARKAINELENVIRFYHIKIPRTMGTSFEYKIANVKDKAFMSSKTYARLIDYLTENENNNTFGIVSIDNDQDFEGGLLVFGKHLGMLFTLFWKDQREPLTKSFEDLKDYANLIFEKLIDLYNLTDLFK